MNYFLRRVLVGVCIALVMMCVHKFAKATDYYWVGDATGKTGTEPLSACKAIVAYQGGPWTNPSVTLNAAGTTGGCYAVLTVNNTVAIRDTMKRVGTSCPAGTSFYAPYGYCTASDGRDGCPSAMHDDSTGGWRQCVADCKSGQEENATGQCIPKRLCAPYEILGVDGFCRVDVSPTAPKQPVLPPHAPTSPPGDDGTCPSGTANVGTDSTGTAMCQGTGTAPTDTKTVKNPTTTKSNADGSSTTTDSDTATNKDGSETTNSTTCTTTSGGTKTCQKTTTTGTKGDGTQGKSDGEGGGGGGSGDDTCTKHPELNICKNAGVKGGCNAGVDTTSCTGDAIQCAILRQQKKEYCENIKPNPSTDLGIRMLGGDDPMQSEIDTAMKGDTVDLSSNKLDQDGFLGGGSCFANRSINASFGSVAWDLGPTCDTLAPLRYIVLLSSLIVAYLVVSKSIIQG